MTDRLWNPVVVRRPVSYGVLTMRSVFVLIDCRGEA